MSHHAMLCRTCATPEGGAPCTTQAIEAALAEAQITGFTVHPVECMSGCTRPGALGFRAPGKTAYLFGDITAADLPGIVAFARAYGESPDGTFADARILGALRLKALARIPDPS